MYSKRIAALAAAGVLAVSGLATSTAHAATAPKPSATVADACAPLSLVNPTRRGAEFHYRVIGHRPVGAVAVPARSTVQQELRPRYGAGALSVQWWARSHDWRAKVKAVRAAEKVLTEAKTAQEAAQTDFDAKAAALPAKTDKWAGSWDKELERLKAVKADPAKAQWHADADAKIALIEPYLAAEAKLADAKDATVKAEAGVTEAKAASYWTRWDRGLVRVAACVTPSPTPTQSPTSTPTPTPTATEEPKEEPEPTPTVTHTTTRVVVIGDTRVPVRVDTGRGGTA